MLTVNLRDDDPDGPTQTGRTARDRIFQTATLCLAPTEQQHRRRFPFGWQIHRRTRDQIPAEFRHRLNEQFLSWRRKRNIENPTLWRLGDAPAPAPSAHSSLHRRRIEPTSSECHAHRDSCGESVPSKPARRRLVQLAAQRPVVGHDLFLCPDPTTVANQEPDSRWAAPPRSVVHHKLRFVVEIRERAAQDGVDPRPLRARRHRCSFVYEPRR